MSGLPRRGTGLAPQVQAHQSQAQRKRGQRAGLGHFGQAQLQRRDPLQRNASAAEMPRSCAAISFMPSERGSSPFFSFACVI